jgi:hypothetical protein
MNFNPIKCLDLLVEYQQYCAHAYKHMKLHGTISIEIQTCDMYKLKIMEIINKMGKTCLLHHLYIIY